MRFLVVTSEYPPRGDSIVIHSYAKEWASNGINVDVLYLCDRLIYPLYMLSKNIEKRNGAGLNKRYMLDNVNVLQIGMRHIFPSTRLYEPITQLYSYFSINKFIKNREYDAIIAHYCTKNYKLLCYLKKKLNVPIVSVFHKCDTKNDALTRKIISISDGVGARSIIIKNYLESFDLEQEVKIINSGIPDYMFCEKINNHKENYFTITYAGKLIKQKNVDILIEAVNLIQNKYHIVLNIIGEGVEKNNLINLSKELNNSEVYFHGQLPRINVHEIMIKTDCFVMTSENETFGLVYLEAMAAGAIVIGSKGQGIDGTIISGQNGYLVEPKDINELAKTIENVIGLTNEEIIRIHKNMAETLKIFRESSIAKDYLNYINHVIGKTDEIKYKS